MKKIIFVVVLLFLFAGCEENNSRSVCATNPNNANGTKNSVDYNLQKAQEYLEKSEKSGTIPASGLYLKTAQTYLLKAYIENNKTNNPNTNINELIENLNK